MSRTVDYYGLSENAIKYLNDNCTTEQVETTIKRNGLIVSSNITNRLICEQGKYSYYGFCDTEYKLNMYIRNDGIKLYEKIQKEVWSSGPNIFTYLEDENGNIIEESKWDESTIEKY